MNEIVKQINTVSKPGSLIKVPGDSVTQYMTDNRNIITKADTQDLKFTHRQYMKKDGTPGKQTITFMQPDGELDLMQPDRASQPDVVFDPELDA